MSAIGSTVTTKPDWDTRDPQACERLGEALSKQGYVYYRSKSGEWLVVDPSMKDGYHTVRSLATNVPVDDWCLRLWCDCIHFDKADSPCVHKAAVYYEVKKPSQYRMYHEGY